MALTARGLKVLEPGKWLTESARGEGQLRAKGGPNGARFYFRYRRADNTSDDLALGRFDASGKSGLTLDQAKMKANEWRARYKAGERDLRAALDSDCRELERERAAEEAAATAAKEAAAAKRVRILAALLTAYADQLERDGKQSARAVRAAFHRHVRDKWPKLWVTPIADLTPDDLLAIVAVSAEAGKLRQAEKIRAYLRAAFAAGMKARHNAKALPSLRALRITSNPARDLTPIEGANNARDRTLSLAELRLYWGRIQHDPKLAVLRFHLLTGCQRIEQLSRATLADVDSDAQSIRLLDIKGRRTVARQHHVPLLPAALEAMRDMNAGASGPFVFTLTAGVSGADYAGIFKRVQTIAAAMDSAAELPGGSFTPGDLRRTVETRLADVGVSRDIRARLQSHGLSGVQDRHYDRHDYLPQTRAALEKLHRLLTESDAKVVSIRKRGA